MLCLGTFFKRAVICYLSGIIVFAKTASVIIRERSDESNSSMSVRGRGTLEVKPSANPFFQTTSSDIGVDPKNNIKWQGNADPAMKRSDTDNNTDSFSFLYTRESDRIGFYGKKAPQTHAKILTKTEFLRQRRAQLRQDGLNDRDLELLAATQQIEIEKPPVEQTLSVWKQPTKYEDPRYPTTSNQYGFKAPTVATFVSERASVPQGFSNSFQGARSSGNSGLTTGITKSTVHDKLTIQFA